MSRGACGWIVCNPVGQHLRLSHAFQLRTADDGVGEAIGAFAVVGAVLTPPERVGEAWCCAPISPGPWGWVAARLRPALIRANRVPRAAAVMSRAPGGIVNRALGRSLIALSSGVGWRDDQRCRHHRVPARSPVPPPSIGFGWAVADRDDLPWSKLRGTWRGAVGGCVGSASWGSILQ